MPIPESPYEQPKTIILTLPENSNMTFILTSIAQAPMTAGTAVIAVLLIVYVFYQRFFHPLAKYPGPFLASLTDLWQVNQFLSLQQPYNLTRLHEKHGPIVRYGPDKLSITHESAIPTIYQSSARLMPKTEFYDAYGAAHPNVFGMRDEAVSQNLFAAAGKGVVTEF